MASSGAGSAGALRLSQQEQPEEQEQQHGISSCQHLSAQRRSMPAPAMPALYGAPAAVQREVPDRLPVWVRLGQRSTGVAPFSSACPAGPA